MLDVIIIVVFTVVAIRVARVVARESTIFREFNQSQALGLFVFLMPLGPIVYLVTVFRLGRIPAVVATAACYVPVLVAAKRGMSAFDRAGTDRVKRAKDAATQAFGAAIAGLMYTAVVLVFAVIGTANGQTGP